MRINQGNFSRLKTSFDAAAQEGILATFIGIGTDFATEVVDQIASTRGCNYFAVQSAKEFMQLMAKEFDYIITCNVFDVVVRLNDGPIVPRAVYGSPGHEIPQNGVLCSITSSSPSLLEDGKTKGGVIVIKVDGAKDNDASLECTFTTEYETRQGKKFHFTDNLTVPELDDGVTSYHSNACARKAVLLTRYVRFVREYLGSQSNEGWATKFKQFIAYFEAEIDELESDAESLTKELQELESLQALVQKQLQNAPSE